MNRRKFLGNTALFSVPMMLKGVPVFAGDGLLHPFLQALAPPTQNCDRILVVIQMNGGNDGLNMVIPLDRYAELNNARGGIMLPASAVLPLTGTTTTGLHPSMGGLQSLFNDGKANLVQGVSYPNPNFSHFQAQDIWFTGSNTLPSPDTGWLGRDLNVAYPNFPASYPSTAMPDPLAIQIGGALPLSLQGPNINMGYNAPNPAALVNVANGTPGQAPASDYGTELTFLRLMKDQSNAYATRITTAYAAQTTLSTMYSTSGNSLSDQLKIVARLIGGGLKTPVYIVNHSDSFDTHVDQVVAGNTTTGYHANILNKLSVAIAAFQDDITRMGKAEKVTGMTFSEFGRRVISNTSNGTDHGSGAPVIFFGAMLNGGVTGTSPVLPTNSTGSTQVPLQYDFRRLYSTVMQHWLCMSSTEAQTVLNGSFATVPIFNGIALQVSGINLTGAWDGAYAKLSFEVYDNDMFDSYVVERSFDNTTFDQVGTVQNTTNTHRLTYPYSDSRMNAPTVYYRIKGLTKQGGIVYSKVLPLTNAISQQLRIYPNPVTNYTINIEFFNSINENVEMTIHGVLGEKLYYNQVNPRGNRFIVLKVPAFFSLQTVYMLHISYSGNTITEKLLFGR